MANGWALADVPAPPGHYIDELTIPIDRFRVPPKELEDALPQQLVMLQVAAAALDDQPVRLDERERFSMRRARDLGQFGEEPQDRPAITKIAARNLSQDQRMHQHVIRL